MRRYIPVLGLLALAWACFTWWPKIRNEFFVILGSRNESGGWYGFHSGFGGSVYLGVIPAMALFYYNHTCHISPWCLRWGKYEAAGGVFKLCRHHHPDLAGQKPHRELIHRLHREYQGQARQPD